MESNDQLDNQSDRFPKDDASIEILTESGDSHFRDSEWSIYSAGRSSIAGSDASSMDFQKLSIHSKMTKIVHHDGRQFIERRDLDDGGLPYSVEFYLGDELWKVNGEDCLLLSHRRYIAKVCVEGTVDLEGAVDFEEAVRTLLKHLKVVKVFLDEQLDECNKAKSVLEMILNKLAIESERNIDFKRDVMLLRILLHKNGNALNMNFKHDLINCSRLSSGTSSTLESYVTKALKLIQRNEILVQMNDSSLSDEFINDAIQKALNAHRIQLAAIFSSTLQDKLKELSDDHILYVTMDDIDLFNDLMTIDKALFKSVLPMIFSKFLTRVQEVNDEHFENLNPLCNRIFLYVYKSLQDVAEQFEALTKTDNAIIYNEALGWELGNLQEESQTPYSKCLRQQLEMLARLANHFEPGGPFRTSYFPYEFKLFQKMDAIPEPVRIWLCLLDDCMKDLVQADMDKMQMLSCFFKSYVSFIASEEFGSETLECLRTITHDALRSLADMKSKHVRATSDSDFLEYNELISSCLDKFLCEHFGNDCNQIQATLRRIINQAMNKNVASQESAELSDAFKQLLKDIRDLPLEWFIQLPPSENRNLLVRSQFIVPEDNRWKDTEHECLKVVDPEGFVKLYNILNNGAEIPKHYQLKAIQVLLGKLAARSSSYEGKLCLDKHQLGALTNMINSIRNSLLCLDRQPDYSCFEDFLKMMGESFSHLIEEKRTPEGSRQSMSPTIALQATDSPHSNPIDFGEPLDPLLELFEGSISKGFLTNGLKKYTTQLNKHLKKTVQLPREKRIEQIVSDVVLKVKPQLATSWTEDFKRKELPEVLAGLSAVWSLIVSKKDISSEKLMKPSNLQISYILSLFGDKNLNDLYKLLYISTQQGKLLVLGLTAALLALYGHKVLIACFNSHLARRNSVHLIEVFKSFAIYSSISFGSVEDMARERSREVYEKYAAYIHESLGLEIKENYINQPSHAFESKRSVLLIEDIDLLLLNKTLGQTFQRYVRPTIPGLALVQEMHYRRNECLNLSKIDQHIKESDDPEMCKLRAFIDKPHSYKVCEGPDCNVMEYKNQCLFNKHLRNYLHINFYVYNMPNYLRISGNGVMTVKTLNDYRYLYDTSYLVLRRSGFQQTVNGYKNYGFLTVGCIPFPYAHLLRSFSLVFGFASSTLDNLEELAIHNHYDIYHKIVKSNPLPIIPVRFESKKDFRCASSSINYWDWMLTIMNAINAAIDRNCSVLVFFKNEQGMEAFQSKFILPLKRLNATAIETASNGKHLTEDEIAVDEVAVLVIEGNDDLAEDREVHVIQTFFSEEAKEENLIRRQAEQNHGSGSYELILNWTHIPSSCYGKSATYDLFVRSRSTRYFGDAVDCLTANMKKYQKVETFCNKL